MKFATVCILSKSIVILTCLARNVFIPFFPLYIKYLNLSLMQMGIIRSLQILIALLFTTLSIKTGKKLSNNTLKRISISGSIFTTVTVCICLLFLPPYKFTRNVTHCVSNEDLNLQDLYNFHFKKNSNSVIKNITNLVIEKDNETFSTDISSQYTRFGQSEVHNLVTIPVTDANEIKEPQLISSKEEIIDNIDYKTKSAQVMSEKAVKNKITEILKKNDQHRFPHVKKNLTPDVSYDYSNEDSVQDANMNAVQITHKKKEKENNFSKKINIIIPSFFDTHTRTYNHRSSISHYQNPKINVVDDIKYPNQEEQDSTKEIKDENIYNSGTIKEEISLPAIYSQYNERNSHDYADLNNIHDDNIASRTGILLGKHSSHLAINKQRNRNEDLQHNKHINYYSGWNVNDRQDEGRKSTKELDELFRKRRSALQSALSGDQKNYSSNNKESFENVSALLSGDKSTNKILFHLNDFVWSETFLFALVLAVLYELFSSQIVPWTETFCYYNTDELNYDHLYASQIFLSKSFLWLFTYPVVAVLTSIALCPYQIALHCFFAAAILVFAFLAALIFLSIDYSETKLFRSRKSSKPPSSERNIRESAHQRIFVSATNILIGACTASYVETILWNFETLSGFPYNYEYLYCGYYSLNVLASMGTSKYLQYRSNNQQLAIDNDSDSDDEYVHFSHEWIKKNKEIIYVEEQKSNINTVSGTFFLSVTLFVVPFLSSAWMLLPLALLKGATDAFLEAMVPQGCWPHLVLGYGLGCFLGAAVANIFGIRGLFYSASSIMLICSFSWLCYSAFLRCFKRPYMRISLEGHSHESIRKEPIMQNEDEEDWLERALQRDQFNQSRKLQQ